MIKANIDIEDFFVSQVLSGRLIVTVDGRIMNAKTGNEIRALRKDGYIQISLKDLEAGKIRTMQAHRLVYRIFHGKIGSEYIINHKDFNKVNNNPDNLEKVTHKENNDHAAKNGRYGGRFKKENTEHRKRKTFGNRYGTFKPRGP
jgi:hypothetical protein